MSSNIKDNIRKILYSNNITRKVCEKRIEFSEWYALAYPFVKQKILHPKAVFLVLTPEHGNLGDHAIAKSEIEMLNKLSIKYIEITGNQLVKLQYSKYLNLMNGRTILVNGGGNLGTLWFNVEKLFRDIIQVNSKSKILLFPNTFYYENSDWGNKELDNSIKIYNKHKKLVLYARERTSYEKMKEIYHDVRLVPDVVLSLKYNKNNERKGCLICLRSDCEKTISSESEEIILSKVKHLFGSSVKRTDMVVNHSVSIEERDDKVNKKLEEFSKAELVITDRLHGMIFAAITSTPCIALGNYNHKIKACSEVLEHLGYIQYVDNIDEIEEKIEYLLSTKFEKYNNDFSITQFEQISKEVFESEN